jgi:hypothetical protein
MAPWEAPDPSGDWFASFSGTSSAAAALSSYGDTPMSSTHANRLLSEPAGNDTNGTANGRDQRGRFVKGNPGGPGDPFNRKVAALRAALLAAVTEQDVQDVLAAMREKAKKGSEAAAKLYLAYTVGRPADTVNPDDMDADEWQLRQQNVAQPKEMRRTFEMPVQLANTVASATALDIVQGMKQQLLAVLRPPVAAPSSNGANGGPAPSANGANGKPSANGTPSGNGENGGLASPDHGANGKPAAYGSNGGPLSNGSNGMGPSSNRANGPSSNGANGGPAAEDLPDILSLIAKMREQAEAAERPAINRNPLQTVMARRS